MNIHQWLAAFRQSWVSHDLPEVMNLFSNDVEYWETPFKQIVSKHAVLTEWSVIANQREISLDLTVFSSTDDGHTVKWKLDYIQDGANHTWQGVYLLRLNNNGICTYFYQVGERKLL